MSAIAFAIDAVPRKASTHTCVFSFHAIRHLAQHMHMDVSLGCTDGQATLKMYQR